MAPVMIQDLFVGVADVPHPVPTVTSRADSLPGADLWGLPLELAVGLIGLGGALIGAAIAGVVTFIVAKWQAGEQLRMARVAQLESRIANMHGLALTLAFEAAAGMANRERFATLMVESGVAQSMADENWPHTSATLHEVSIEMIDALHPDVNASGESTATDELNAAQLRYRKAMFAVYAVTSTWLAAPEQFERRKTSPKQAAARVDSISQRTAPDA